MVAVRGHRDSDGEAALDRPTPSWRPRTKRGSEKGVKISKISTSSAARHLASRLRAVPVPAELMCELRRLARGKQPDEPLWSWCQQTAWRRVRRAMAEAGIIGVHASTKGLRHTFGVQNAEHNIPMPLTRDWMGHARIDTTAIYQHAVGREERSFARRLRRGYSGASTAIKGASLEDQRN